MAELKHIAKETILILGLQGAGNECLATILDAHPELHVPGRVESQSESGKFHFSYDIKSPSSLRFYPPKYNENTEDVMYEILEQSEQLTYREDGPPLIYGSHQFYDYTASIFENLKIICTLPRFTATNKKHFLANYMAKNYERDKSEPKAFMNGIERFYKAISQLHKYDVCHIFFEDFFMYQVQAKDYLHVCEFLNILPVPNIYFDTVNRFKNYG